MSHDYCGKHNQRAKVLQKSLQPLNKNYSTCCIYASQKDVNPKAGRIWHQKHSDTYAQYSIHIDFFASKSISHVPKYWCANELYCNIERNDECISKILYLLFSFNLKRFLQQKRLERIYTYKNERKHKIVSKAAYIIFSCDIFVERNLITTSFHNTIRYQISEK